MAALRVVVHVDLELSRSGIKFIEEAAVRIIKRVGHRRIDRADPRHRRGGHRLFVAVVRANHRHIVDPQLRRRFARYCRLRKKTKGQQRHD